MATQSMVTKIQKLPPIKEDVVSLKLKIQEVIVFVKNSPYRV